MPLLLLLKNYYYYLDYVVIKKIKKKSILNIFWEKIITRQKGATMPCIHSSNLLFVLFSLYKYE